MNFCKVWVKELGLNKLNGVLHGLKEHVNKNKNHYTERSLKLIVKNLILCIQVSAVGFLCMLQYSPFFLPSPSYGGFYTLYRPFLIIWALHLSIIQASIWASVPSDIFFSSLWVAVAKVTLFKGLLYINTVRRVAIMHSMWRWQLLLRYFVFPSFSHV